MVGWLVLAPRLALSQPASAPTPTVYVALFSTPGCKGCAVYEQALKETLADLHEVELVRFDPTKREDLEVLEVLADRAGLDSLKIAQGLVLFVGTDYLSLRASTPDDTRRVIAKYRGVGTGRFFEVTAEERAHAAITHVRRFRAFRIATVALAGLADGVNPCAFATVMFLLSYLAWLGRSRRDILLAGLFFALGIFTPYYLIGVGVLHFSRELAALPVLRHWLFEAAAAAALVFAVVSLLDARKARAGNTSAMTLKLPRFVRARIHETVRESARAGMVAGAFFAGAACALLEAICTGQLYLPTIIYVAGIAEFQSQALLYLLLYNLAFLVPLIAVVLVIYRGLSSAAIGKFAESRTAVVKAGLGVVFALLAVLLHLSA